MGIPSSRLLSSNLEIKPTNQTNKTEETTAVFFIDNGFYGTPIKYSHCQVYNDDVLSFINFI